MEVKQAVSTAKRYISDLLEDEGVANVNLEEVNFDDQAKLWLVTIGYTRREQEQNRSRGPYQDMKDTLREVHGVPQSKRLYKVVKILDPDGKVTGVDMLRTEFGN